MGDAVSKGSENAGRTILLVDDEEPIRAIVRKVLSRAGHRIIEAKSGSTAIAAGAENRGSIDLLITDLELPEMRGPEIFEALRAENPQMRVLFMSGFGEFDPARSGASIGENFLPKPFSLQELEAAVDTALR